MVQALKQRSHVGCRMEPGPEAGRRIQVGAARFPEGGAQDVVRKGGHLVVGFHKEVTAHLLGFRVQSPEDPIEEGEVHGRELGKENGGPGADALVALQTAPALVNAGKEQP